MSTLPPPPNKTPKMTGSRRCTRRWRATTRRCGTPRMCSGCASRRSCRTGSWATRSVFCGTWCGIGLFMGFVRRRRRPGLIVIVGGWVCHDRLTFYLSHARTPRHSTPSCASPWRPFRAGRSTTTTWASAGSLRCVARDTSTFHASPSIDIALTRYTRIHAHTHVRNTWQVDQSLPADKQVQGIVIYSSRAKSIAAWLQSMELCFIKVRY